MLLLSRLFPKLRSKSDKTRGVTAETDSVPPGEKPPEFNYKISLLDDSELALNVKPSAKGQAVLDKVFSHLNLIEKDYFGLRFLDNTNQTHWLDPGKTVNTQVKTPPPNTLYFGVKFYAADPCKLNEEITRYQFFLQAKRDVLQGRLPVTFDLAAELAAYNVQSELGDYDPKRHSLGYVSEFHFVPNQTEELEERIAQIHHMLVGQVPAAAEYRYLDKVKWLEMYGVDLHPVQGEGNIEYFLGLTPTGIVVYRNKSKVGNYFWPRLTKITFKAKFFMVRVRDKNNDENTYAFECTSKASCKHLWKCCIEHHSFFRLTSASESYKASGKLLSFGSKYRYSGRTERQILEDASNRPPPQVVRRPSKRHTRRATSEGRMDVVGTGSLTGGVDTESIVAGTVTFPSKPGKKRSAYHRPEGYQSAPDSPRSTRSAPWLNNNQHKGGLYTSGRESPLSVRSEKMMFPKRVASGSESESGYSRRRHQPARLESETESEVGHQRRYRRRRNPADCTTESESEVNYRQRQRRNRKSTESLPQTENNWKDIQQRIRDGNNGPYPLRPNGSLTSMQSDPTGGAAARRRRKRSRSPGNRKPPEELAQHFKYVDPEEEGLTEEQMKEIGYEAVVVTGVPPVNVKKASRSRHKSPKPRSMGDVSERAVAPSGSQLPDGEAPPPYQHQAGKVRSRSRPRSEVNLRAAAQQQNRSEAADTALQRSTSSASQPAGLAQEDTKSNASQAKPQSNVHSQTNGAQSGLQVAARGQPPVTHRGRSAVPSNPPPMRNTYVTRQRPNRASPTDIDYAPHTSDQQYGGHPAQRAHPTHRPHPAQGGHPAQRNFPQVRDYPQRGYPQVRDIPQNGNYPQVRDFPQNGNYPQVRDFPQNGNYPQVRDYPQNGNYPQVRDFPQNETNPDYFHKPALVKTNHTNSAPVVKTKQPQGYPSPMSGGAPSSQPSPVTPGGQYDLHAEPLTPSDTSQKHTRDDSGLGADQDNGSLNSSSSLTPKYFYTGPPAPGSEVIGGSYPCHVPPGSYPPTPSRGWAAMDPSLPLDQSPHRMASPASNIIEMNGHSHNYHPASHPEGPGSYNQHMYTPPGAKAAYRQQVTSEGGPHPHYPPHPASPRHHLPPTASPSHRYHSMPYHSNSAFSPAGARYNTHNSYSTHNGSGLRSHSEKMTEL